jgi:hypothetical protein
MVVGEGEGMDTGAVLFDSNRTFQLWAYSPSKDRLLLRSNRSSETLTTLDVLFWLVSGVCLPSLMHGLRVSVGIEIAAAKDLNLDLQDGLTKSMLVEGRSFRGFVVAHSVSSFEDERSFEQPSNLMQGPGLRT